MYVWAGKHGFAHGTLHPPPDKTFFRFHEVEDLGLWLEEGFPKPLRLHIGLLWPPRRLMVTTSFFDGERTLFDDQG